MLFAQTDPVPRVWSLQTYGFVARYHDDIGFNPAKGIGLAIGHNLRRNWLSGAVNLEYTRAAQTLQLIEGSHETYTNIYRSFLSLRGQWPAKKRAIVVFANLLGGYSFFRPQALTIDAGTVGQITFRPQGETKLVLAWSSGLEFRIGEAVSVLLSMKQHFSRFAIRRIDGVQTRMGWRPYWNYGFGLSLIF